MAERKNTHRLTTLELLKIRIALADQGDAHLRRAARFKRQQRPVDAKEQEHLAAGFADLRNRFFGTESVVITYPQEG